jgi:type IV pilus assembly protein PilX
MSRYPSRQQGMALVTSLLLLVIITLLALSMFRSFGTQERIAGNLREKQRALLAAENAQQYAEWWLTQGNNTAVGDVTCAVGAVTPASVTVGQICTSTLQAQGITLSQVPWTLPGSGPIQQYSYTPLGMVIMSSTYAESVGNLNPPYYAAPAFYIADRGPAADGQGEAYQIDAYGYGSAASTVAVVESTYEIQQGVVNRGGL